MPFRRVVMQPTFDLTAATSQEVRFATRTTGWKTAVAWVNVFANSAGAKTDIDFHGGSTESVSSDLSLSPGFWPLLDTISINPGAIGAVPSSPIVNLPDYLRWRVPAYSGGVVFEIVLYLWET